MSSVQDLRTARENVNKTTERLRQQQEEEVRLALLCLSEGLFTLPDDREEIEQLVLALADPSSNIRQVAESSEAMPLVVKAIKDVYRLKDAKRTNNGTEWCLKITRDGVDTYRVTLGFDKVDDQEMCNITAQIVDL